MTTRLLPPTTAPSLSASRCLRTCQAQPDLRGGDMRRLRSTLPVLPKVRILELVIPTLFGRLVARSRGRYLTFARRSAGQATRFQALRTLVFPMASSHLTRLEPVCDQVESWELSTSSRRLSTTCCQLSTTCWGFSVSSRQLSTSCWGFSVSSRQLSTTCWGFSVSSRQLSTSCWGFSVNSCQLSASNWRLSAKSCDRSARCQQFPVRQAADEDLTVRMDGGRTSAGPVLFRREAMATCCQAFQPKVLIPLGRPPRGWSPPYVSRF